MDVFSTEYLMGVVESLVRPPSFILDRYFNRVETFTSEEIHFDVIDKKRRIAPFVSPYAPGKLMNKQGRKVNTFAPAYTKDKRIFEPSLGFKRAAGEQIGGNQLLPAQRIELAIVENITDQVEILTRRMEMMAVEALRTGKNVIAGENYPSVTVDFGRDASATPANLAGAAKWNNADTSTPTPLDNLRTWALNALKLSGNWTVDVFMPVLTFQNFIKIDQVKERWQALQAGNLGTNIQLGVQFDGEGAVKVGSIDQFNIYVYAGWYTAETDAGESLNEILPDGYIFGVGSRVDGVRAYGAIKDHDSLQAVEYFPKSWTENDPSARYLMLQSAPLMVPTRPNASFGVKVY